MKDADLYHEIPLLLSVRAGDLPVPLLLAENVAKAIASDQADVIADTLSMLFLM
jgi:hypothetical protein